MHLTAWNLVWKETSEFWCIWCVLGSLCYSNAVFSLFVCLCYVYVSYLPVWCKMGLKSEDSFVLCEMSQNFGFNNLEIVDFLMKITDHIFFDGNLFWFESTCLLNSIFHTISNFKKVQKLWIFCFSCCYAGFPSSFQYQLLSLDWFVVLSFKLVRRWNGA